MIRRLVPVFIFLAVAGSVRAQAVSVAPLKGPAAAPATCPTLTLTRDGVVSMSWVEPNSGGNTLRLARFNAATNQWQAAQTIVAAASVTTNPYDVPQIAFAGDGTGYALWTDGHGGAWLSTAPAGAARWSAPVRWGAAEAGVEKFALTRLADGRVLVVWLDGRGRQQSVDRQQLRARTIGESADHLVDASTCDCCPTSVVAFLDGGALVAYRGRTDNEVRDIQTARFDGKAWQEPRRLSADEWHVTACPMNGPRLATDGSRVGAVWFTAADNQPRVLASYSPDAGARWLMPLQLDLGHPAGHGDIVVLRDGTVFVLWLETDGSVWLRRITPDFTADHPVQLGGKGAASVRGSPRLALVEDYAGGHTAARVLAAYATNGQPSHVETALVTVPEGDLLTAERHCDCAPTPEQLLGFPIRGKLVAADGTSNTVHVRHGAVPGVLAAGEHDFRVDPLVLATVQPGRAFLGRISQGAQGWELSDIRYLATQAAPER